jgi:hypothetical protein
MAADEEDDETVDAAVVQVEVEDRDDDRIVSSPPLGDLGDARCFIFKLVVAALRGLGSR